jgi:hypothetical protein
MGSHLGCLMAFILGISATIANLNILAKKYNSQSRETAGYDFLIALLL